MLNIDETLLDKLSANECIVLLRIASRMNKERQCFPNQNTLRKETGLSRSVLIRTLRSLCDKDIIEKEQRRAKKGEKVAFSSNIYTVKTHLINKYAGEKVDIETIQGEMVEMGLFKAVAFIESRKFYSFLVSEGKLKRWKPLLKNHARGVASLLCVECDHMEGLTKEKLEKAEFHHENQVILLESLLYVWEKLGNTHYEIAEKNGGFHEWEYLEKQGLYFEESWKVLKGKAVEMAQTMAERTQKERAEKELSSGSNPTPTG